MGGEYPELFEALENPSKKKWLDITSLVYSCHVPIFYLYAANCEEDYKQFERISKATCIYPLAFNGLHHGNTMYPFNYPYFLRLEQSQLCILQKFFEGQVITKTAFARHTMPLKELLFYQNKYYFKKIMNKVKLITGEALMQKN